MKKKIITVSILVLILVISTANFAEDNSNLNISVDDELVKFDSAKPYIDSKVGRTMVPVRFVTEAMHVNVEWDAENQKVSLEQDGKIVEMFIGNKNYVIKNEEDEIVTKKMDVAPIIKESRTIVPLRFVTESFNGNVEWKNDTRTVIIKSKYYDPTEKLRTTEIPSDLEINTVNDIKSQIFTAAENIHNLNWVEIDSKKYKFVPNEIHERYKNDEAARYSRVRVYLTGNIVDENNDYIKNKDSEPIVVGNGYSVSIGSKSIEVSTGSNYINDQVYPVLNGLFRRYLQNNILDDNKVARLSGASDVLDNGNNYFLVEYEDFKVEAEVDSNKELIILKGKEYLINE